MPEVKFVEDAEAPDVGFNILTMLGKKPTKGQVGLEIEVEGTKLPNESNTPEPWEFHVDGSLRGQENGEYVLSKPLDFDDIPKALDILWKKFKALKTTFDVSNRTSVHVHLNFQEFHLNRLTAFLALYYAVEEPLTAWCGSIRVGNLFCLRAVDAPALITHLRKFIKANGDYPLHETLHYGALNPNALKKYGSLEFRTLGGCSEPGRILQWLGILRRLYEYSEKFVDPTDAVSLFSSGGPLSFFNNVLGPQAVVVREGLDWTDEDIKQSVFRGIRFAQQLAYCRDWATFTPFEMKPDPWDRDPKKVANKVMAAAGAAGIASAPHQGVATPVHESTEQYLQAVLNHAPQGFIDVPETPDWDY